jgi:hypothetical protein
MFATLELSRRDDQPASSHSDQKEATSIEDAKGRTVESAIITGPQESSEDCSFAHLREKTHVRSLCNTIRSVDCHESLANGKSIDTTQRLKRLILGRPVNPFKYRAMIQKKGRRVLRKPTKSCVSSLPTLNKTPIRRRMVSTKSSSLLVQRRTTRILKLRISNKLSRSYISKKIA